MNAKISCKHRQQGAVMVMLAIGMAVLIGMAGMGMDMGHAYVNKTRLQNLVDATALAGAKTLDETGDTLLARDAIDTLFNLTVAGAGNEELGQHLGAADLTVEFSDTLYPFVPGGAAPRYVRVRVDSIALNSWLIRTLGISEKRVGASAVSGPSPTLGQVICDAAPMMACGDTSYPPSLGEGVFWGFDYNQVWMLKASDPAQTACSNLNGNFYLIRVDMDGDGVPDSGAAVVREAMAGNAPGCTDATDGIETEPGNTIGPSIQGLNTRFGEYLGPMGNSQDQYPPDVIVAENTVTILPPEPLPTGEECGGPSSTTPSDLDFNWDDYDGRRNGPYDYAPPEGVFERRVLKIPIGDCTVVAQGQSTIPYLGTGCFFLLQKIPGGGASDDPAVYGQFLEDCTLDGVLGPLPTNGPGPYKIILYEDPDSTDS